MPLQPLPGQHRAIATTTIDAPAAEVWAVLADYCGMHTWAPSIEHTESISDAKQGVGAARRNTAKGFGAVDQTVSEWIEGEGYTYQVGEFGPFEQTHTAYTLDDTGGDTTQCRLELSFDMRDPSPDATPNGAQMSAKLSGGLSAILEALKKRVETGELVRPRV